jgi:hypothetical protein
MCAMLGSVQDDGVKKTKGEAKIKAAHLKVAAT